MSIGVRVALTVAAAAAVILSAPFTQQGVEALIARGPEEYRRAAMAATAVPVGVAMVIALVRIRERRAFRYAALVTGVALGAVYGWIANVSLAEAFHFVEYGAIALLLYWACRPLGDASMLMLPVIGVTLAGTLDEWFQWFIPIRAGEARDVALNGAVAACAVLVGVGLAPPRAMTFGPRATARVAFWTAATVVTFVLFFSSVHLGHNIVSGEIGTFRSRYTQPRLEAITAERMNRWQAQPPLQLRRLSREDQYLTEGLWHVRWRNMASTGGDLVTAWRENLILERFYAPVIDTPSYSSATGHRWAPEQRAEAAAAAAAATNPQPYSSEAYPYPMYAWPSGGAALLLLKVLLVPGLVAGVTLAVRRWGPSVGGWLAGLPLVAGPVLVFYAVEQGVSFAATAAQATMAGMAANAVFSLVYARLSQRVPWYVCVPAGWSVFAIVTLSIFATRPSLMVSLFLPIGAVIAARLMLPPAEAVAPPGAPPRGDLAIRLVASAALVLALTSLAGRLGPMLSGLLAAFPVIITTVAAFTHVQRGPAAVASFFNGFVPAILGFVFFCFIVAVLIESAGVLTAVMAALAVQLALHGTIVRWLTRPTRPTRLS